ncbi:hypothetical protein E2C01_058636 [Portunus trituberculatus]|uniref:Uncharacterized protein n=1 Tax=Portunus trituberculatus TaxID=210409 RepID=A0A5B7H5Z2_PORTR|nr:hypothetical protein [Portunus trituberculatus]
MGENRRTERFWAGLSKDLVIEQTLMRTMKSAGGLVHGRGVLEEKQRNKWLLSLPVTATFNESMQELTNRNFEMSEQHKELNVARVERDNKDARTVFRFLCEHNPFEQTPELCSIISGIAGDSSVNVHQAVLVGEAILEKMYGINAFEFFSKKDFAVVLDQTRQLNIDGEKVQVDPQLLFQRPLAIGKARTDENDIDQLVQCELSPSPPALFDEYGLLR